MKKALIIASAIIALAVTVGAVSMSRPKPTDEFLYEAGFKNIPTLTGSSDADYWERNYHLKFFSFADMDALCKANGFIVGTSDRYTGIVPEKAAKLMQTNYNRIKDDLQCYELVMLADQTKVISRFKIGELRGRAKRALPAFDSYNWAWGFSSWELYRFVKDKAIKSRLLNKDLMDFGIRTNYEYNKIYVIGHNSKFNTVGMNIGPDLAAIPMTPERKDPLAVCKTSTGWVVLSSWE